MNKTIYVGIRLPADLAEQLDIARHDLWQSRSRFIRDALERYLIELSAQPKEITKQ